MSLFSRPRKAAPPTAAAQPQRQGPPVEDLGGDAIAYHFRAELAAGRWQEFHDFLESSREWDSRAFYVARLSKISGRPGWLDEWSAARPASPLPVLFRGAHGIHWAWEVRGMRRANTVQSDAWPVFFARLTDADRDLAQAAGLDDVDPTPHALGIRVALGLSLPQAERGRRFNEAVRRHPWHREAHTLMIQALSLKWSGSHEAMFEFARWASAHAPEGHSVHKVIAMAHLERWLELAREPDGGEERQRAYFLGELVREEVYRAAYRSVRSASYATSLYAPADRNVFAMCFALMRDYGAQLEQMRLIGPLIQAIPWQYQGDPGLVYEQARARALRAMGQAGSTGPPPRAP